MENLKIISLMDLKESLAGEELKAFTYPWEVLPEIKNIIIRIGQSLSPEIFEKRGEDIWIAKSATIHKSADITGPCIIDEEATLRPGAFLRGSVLVGKAATVGNSTELKNVILFNKVEVPHYNYVGDSILGYKAHMGAGAITSNIKSDRTNVVIKGDGIKVETGLRKMGAILGDFAEIGCNSVLNPGSIIGSHTTVYPLSMVRGVVPKDSVYKNKPTTEIVEKRDL